jgi:protein involved in polysaccharide export with SLBB domain
MNQMLGRIQLFFVLVIAVLLIAPESQAQSPNGTPEPVQTPASPNNNVEDKKTRVETDSEEEAAILPYYNNYLRDYHLGPEDTISVEVFGQPSYSKTSIVVPPNARISYPLIPGGVFVGGKTVDEVAETIKKKLDEYIIDPQVTVTLDKVGSARFSVLGIVGSPGVKVMNRRYTLYEALAEAGGIQKGGDKERIMLIRLDPQGGVTQRVYNLDKVVKGRVEVPYLVPGDQIIVPEKRWSLGKIFNVISRASAAAVLFGVPL